MSNRKGKGSWVQDEQEGGAQAEKFIGLGPFPDQLNSHYGASRKVSGSIRRPFLDRALVRTEPRTEPKFKCDTVIHLSFVPPLQHQHLKWTRSHG